MKLNLAPTELIDQLRAWFHPKDRVITLSDSQWINSKRVAWEAAISKSLALPGLVGFWPMSSVQRSTGDAYDLSGQGRTLTYNGNPVYSIYKDFTPYIELDGTGDYLARADETDLDILGTETIYAAAVRGLTFGGWFYPNSVTGTQQLIGKENSATNNISYRLVLVGTTVFFQFSDLGTAASTQSVTLANGVTINNWYFIVGRFIPSTTGKVFSNISSNSAATVKAALFNGNAPFEIGRHSNNTEYFTGRASLCFLCANALPDELILAKYYQERMLFQ